MREQNHEKYTRAIYYMYLWAGNVCAAFPYGKRRCSVCREFVPLTSQNRQTMTTTKGENKETEGTESKLSASKAPNGRVIRNANPRLDKTWLTPPTTGTPERHDGDKNSSPQTREATSNETKQTDRHGYTLSH